MGIYVLRGWPPTESVSGCNIYMYAVIVLHRACVRLLQIVKVVTSSAHPCM